MPLYEYECATCEKVHEVMQKFSDAPLEKCPECGNPVKKLVSLSSFSLKGSGWYSTGYSSSPAPTEKKSESSENKRATDTKKKEKAPSKPEALEKKKA